MEWQDELGLNVTAMDYRQYDNAIGRFNGIDALAELQYSYTPYHFSYNNPVYYTDPSGLLSVSQMPDYLQAAWYATPNGTNSSWVNDGGGNFDNVDGSSYITKEGHFELSMVSLSTVTVRRGAVWAGNFIDIVQNHVYENSPFYKELRAKNTEAKWYEFAGDLQNMGDAISVIGYALTLTGIGAEIGVPLIALGNGISLAGTVVEIGIDIASKKYEPLQFAEKFVAKSAVELIPAGFGRYFKGTMTTLEKQHINSMMILLDRTLDDGRNNNNGFYAD